MDLSAFTTRLESLVGRPTQVRPFVCDGSPLNCQVFIVGANPATSMEKDWWDFWYSSYGFRRKAWLEHYLVERARQPLKPGKTRRMPISNTRRVLDWITEAAYPLKCLETNIYSVSTSSTAMLGAHQRATAVFDFLLDAARPRLVIAHGKDAEEHLTGRIRLIEPGHPEPLTGEKMRMMVVPHLSRGWSREAATGLGADLRKVVKG